MLSENHSEKVVQMRGNAACVMTGRRHCVLQMFDVVLGEYPFVPRGIAAHYAVIFCSADQQEIRRVFIERKLILLKLPWISRAVRQSQGRADRADISEYLGV